MAGGGTVSLEALAICRRGVRNVLAHLGVLPPEDASPRRGDGTRARAAGQRRLRLRDDGRHLRAASTRRARGPRRRAAGRIHCTWDPTRAPDDAALRRRRHALRPPPARARAAGQLLPRRRRALPGSARVIGLDDIARGARAHRAPRAAHAGASRSTSAKDRRSPTRASSLKLECLQVTGSFKARGAMNRLLGDAARGGCATASSPRRAATTALRSRAPPMSPACRRRSSCPRTSRPPRSRRCKGWKARGRDRRRGLGRVERGGARVRRRSTGAPISIPSPIRSSSRARARSALEILEDLPGLDLDPRRDRRRRPDLAGMATALKALQAGHPHHRRRADRLADAEGEPRRRPTSSRCPRSRPRVPTMACRRTDERIFETRARHGRRHRARHRRGDGGRRRAGSGSKLGVAADLSGAAAVAALRQRRVALAGAASVCALVCGAGPDGMG